MRGSCAGWKPVWIVATAAGLLCLLPGCDLLGESDSSGTTSGSASAPAAEAEPVDPRTERDAEIYAAVVRRLVEKDHTYGGADPRFKAVDILDGALERAGNPMNPWRQAPRHRFDDALKTALKERLSGLPPVTFILRRTSALARDSVRVPRKNRRALVTLGPIVGSGLRVEVSANLAINGYPAIWLTYVVRERASGWKVVGTTGPLAIT